MWEFIGALVAGIVTLFTQQGINEKNWNKQNEYNEDMYNKYASPQAQAEQLAATGMSDAGIGAALSGGNYAPAINLTSSPLENAQVPDISSMFKNLKSGKLDESQIKLNISNVELNEYKKRVENMNAEVLGAKFFEINENANLLKDKHLITLKEYDILCKSAEALVDMNINQAKKLLIDMLESNERINNLQDQHKINAAKVLESELNAKYLKEFGLTKEDFDTSNPFKMIGLLFKSLLGSFHAENGIFN